MRNAQSAGVLYACQVVYTLFTGQREIKREEREGEKEGGRERKREGVRKGEREKERESEKERVFIFKGMTGTLAPFSYIFYKNFVKSYQLLCVTHALV
jgi:hypothetical protein